MAQDELEEIDGIKPNVWLPDGEEREVGSQSSNTIYKVKRTMDHYYCTCPAWRNQGGVPVNARTCKHLKSLLGDKYENARVKMKNPDGPPPKGGAKAKPASKAKTAPKTSSKRKRPADEDEDEEEEEEEDEKPKRGRKAPASKAKVAKGKGKKKQEEVEEDEDQEDDNENQEDGDENEDQKPPPTNQQDELAEINGIKPKVWLPDGEEREVSSQSSNSVYKVKRTWDHYYCTCPAWRNQSGAPVNARSCKHLKALLGDKYENERVKMKNPDGSQPSPAKRARKAPAPKTPKGKGKKKQEDDDEDEDEGEDQEDDEDAPASGKSVPELLLANKWDIEKGPDPTGWWTSEKLDGVRAFYDGTQFISRLGNPFTPPIWFLEKLPNDVTLDGELYGGRGEFQSTVSIVKTVNSVHWKNISFQIFDIPSRGQESFEKRYDFLQKTFGEKGTHAADQICVVQHELAKSRQHVLDKLKEVEALGGEGLMLRKPGSAYEGRRSGSLLKIKTFYDAEAVVTGHAPGKGRNKGLTGALKCKMESGKNFNVGSGLTDKIRQSPPKIGSIITYRFQELTRDGVPRFPSFVGIAIDKDGPKDAQIPDHRKTGAVAGGEDA